MDIVERAISILATHLSKEEILELHEAIDGDPNDSFFELLTLKAAELSPDDFVCTDGPLSEEAGPEAVKE